jgi:DNA-directed RNA polymerase subunit RPC12/RpoP
MKGLAGLIAHLGAEPRDMSGNVACTECGSEEFEYSTVVDVERDAQYADSRCKRCGHSVGGEV